MRNSFYDYILALNCGIAFISLIVLMVSWDNLKGGWLKWILMALCIFIFCYDTYLFFKEKSAFDMLSKAEARTDKHLKEFGVVK